MGNESSKNISKDYIRQIANTITNTPRRNTESSKINQVSLLRKTLRDIKPISMERSYVTGQFDFENDINTLSTCHKLISELIFKKNSNKKYNNSNINFESSIIGKTLAGSECFRINKNHSDNDNDNDCNIKLNELTDLVSDDTELDNSNDAVDINISRNNNIQNNVHQDRSTEHNKYFNYLDKSINNNSNSNKKVYYYKPRASKKPINYNNIRNKDKNRTRFNNPNDTNNRLNNSKTNSRNKINYSNNKVDMISISPSPTLNFNTEENHNFVYNNTNTNNKQYNDYSYFKNKIIGGNYSNININNKSFVRSHTPNANLSQINTSYISNIHHNKDLSRSISRTEGSFLKALAYGKHIFNTDKSPLKPFQPKKINDKVPVVVYVPNLPVIPRININASSNNYKKSVSSKKSYNRISNLSNNNNQNNSNRVDNSYNDKNNNIRNVSNNSNNNRQSKILIYKQNYYNNIILNNNSSNNNDNNNNIRITLVNNSNVNTINHGTNYQKKTYTDILKEKKELLLKNRNRILNKSGDRLSRTKTDNTDKTNISTISKEFSNLVKDKDIDLSKRINLSKIKKDKENNKAGDMLVTSNKNKFSKQVKDNDNKKIELSDDSDNNDLSREASIKIKESKNNTNNTNTTNNNKILDIKKGKNNDSVNINKHSFKHDNKKDKKVGFIDKDIKHKNNIDSEINNDKFISQENQEDQERENKISNYQNIKDKLLAHKNFKKIDKKKINNTEINTNANKKEDDFKYASDSSDHLDMNEKNEKNDNSDKNDNNSSPDFRSNHDERKTAGFSKNKPLGNNNNLNIVHKESDYSKFNNNNNNSTSKNKDCNSKVDERFSFNNPFYSNEMNKNDYNNSNYNTISNKETDMNHPIFEAKPQINTYVKKRTYIPHKNNDHIESNENNFNSLINHKEIISNNDYLEDSFGNSNFNSTSKSNDDNKNNFNNYANNHYNTINTNADVNSTSSNNKTFYKPKIKYNHNNSNINNYNNNNLNNNNSYNTYTHNIDNNIDEELDKLNDMCNETESKTVSISKYLIIT